MLYGWLTSGLSHRFKGKFHHSRLGSIPSNRKRSFLVENEEEELDSAKG